MRISNFHIRAVAAIFAVLCTGMAFSALIHQRVWEATFWATLDEVATYMALHFGRTSERT